MSVNMKALKPFSNPQIAGPRENGAVLPGDEFATDWLHAKELARNVLAEAVDGNDLAVEPTDAVEASNQLSVPQHAAINERRGKARAAAQASDASKGR